MLTMVTIQNARSGTLFLPLEDSSGGYVVESVQGLDPVKAELTSYSLAQIDGAQFEHARRGPRNILIKLGLEPDFAVTSVAGLRTVLYDYFMPKSSVTVGLYADGDLWGIATGVVESMENDMFSADPKVDISIICHDPDFYAPDPVVVSGSTVSNSDTQTVTYEGTTDTGVIFTLTFPDAASEIRLYNTRPDNVVNMVRLAGDFLADDVLTVRSELGDKSITVTTAGMTYSALFYRDASSDWISLTRGDNLFRAYYDGTAIPFTLEYTPRFGGF